MPEEEKSYRSVSYDQGHRGHEWGAEAGPAGDDGSGGPLWGGDR